MQEKAKRVYLFFVILSAIHMMVVAWGFFEHATEGLSWGVPMLFNVLVWVCYSLIYVSLLLIPLFGVVKLFGFSGKITAAFAIVMSSIAMLLLSADLMIYDLYNFHFNGFIWNLVTTRGGISSLGSGTNTYFAIVFSALVTIGIQCVLWLISAWLIKTTDFNLEWKHLLWFILPWMAVQTGIYGVADIKNNGAVLASAQAYPFYKKVTFRSLAKKIGIDAVRKNDSQLSIDTSRIQYPLTKVVFSSVAHPPNIVILAAESLRWDRLTPEIMPNAWRLAQKGLHFRQHYSSGNGTREGLFGMFYGLYGSYWNSFLYAQQSPLLIDRAQSLGYEFDMRTSAKFSYPEFNKTLFAKVPLAKLHEEDDNKAPWERDRDNATGLIDFVHKADKTKPFMTFFFFESTHARYDFPEEAVIASPYLKDVNYWGMSRKSLAPKIGELKNRYTNSAHWIDVQVGRIYDALEAEGLLENTVIIITGDHGEEFLEKGFWGHNSSFVEEQTHVPMVMWVPGQAHQEIDYMTSHLDIGTTLLQLLGAPKDSHAYSLGSNILEAADRKYIVVSDWHSIGVMAADMKYRIPYSNKGFEHWEPVSAKDEPLDEARSSALLKTHQGTILDAVKNSSLFLQRKK